jgi:hypothetical protein
VKVPHAVPEHVDPDMLHATPTLVESFVSVAVKFNVWA